MNDVFEWLKDKLLNILGHIPLVGPMLAHFIRGDGGNQLSQSVRQQQLAQANQAASGQNTNVPAAQAQAGAAVGGQPRMASAETGLPSGPSSVSGFPAPAAALS